MDKHTFGKTACAENLVAILEELGEEKTTQKISAFLKSNNERLKALEEVTDPRIRAHFRRLLLTSLETQTLEVPEKVYTHAINILVARKREKERAE